MVSLEEAKGQLAARQAQIEQVRRQISEAEQAMTAEQAKFVQARQQIGAYDPRIIPTRREMQKVTPTVMARLRGLIGLRTGAKEQAVGALTTQQQAFEQEAAIRRQQMGLTESQLAASEAEMARVSKQISDIEAARAWKAAGRYQVSELPPGARKYVTGADIGPLERLQIQMPEAVAAGFATHEDIEASVKRWKEGIATPQETERLLEAGALEYPMTAEVTDIPKQYITKTPISTWEKIKGVFAKTPQERLAETRLFQKYGPGIYEAEQKFVKGFEKRFPVGVKARPGEIIYKDPSGRWGKSLPYGMTPFSRGVEWYQVKEGKLVPIERPTTAVGEISKVYWRGTELLERPLEWAREKRITPISLVAPTITGIFPEEITRRIEEPLYKPREITPELYDLPGQIGLMYFFSPAISEFRAAKMEKTVKAVSKGKEEKIVKAMEKLWKKKLLKARLGKYSRQIRLQEDISKREIGTRNLRILLDEAQKRGFIKGYILDERTGGVSFIQDVYKTQVITKIPKIVKPALEVFKPGARVVAPPGLVPGAYTGLGLLRGYERVLTPEEERELLRQERLLEGRPLETYGEPTKFIVPEPVKLGVKPAVAFTGLTGLGIAISPRVEAITKAEERAREKERTKVKEVLKVREALKPALRLGLGLRQPQALRQRIGLGLGLGLGLRQPQALKQPLKLKLRQPTIQRPRVGKPGPPPPPPLGWLWWDFNGRRKRRAVKRAPPREGIFVAEIRRRGVWLPIAKAKDPFKVAKVAKRRARETLGVSIRVRGPRGIVPLAPSPFFKRAKREPGVLVQPRGLRLARPSEVLEIQRARRAKRGGNQFFK